MKKIVIFLIIILSFSFGSMVKAELAGDFTCSYKASGLPGNANFEFKIEVKNYKKPACGDASGDATIYYQSKDDTAPNTKLSKFNDHIDDIKRDKKGKSNVIFFGGKNQVNEFIKLFDGSCPTLYWYDSAYDINTNINYFLNTDSMFKPENGGSNGTISPSGTVSSVADIKITDETCKYTLDFSNDNSKGDTKELLIDRKKNANNEIQFDIRINNEDNYTCVDPRIQFSRTFDYDNKTIVFDETYELLTSHTCIDGNKIYTYKDQSAWHVTTDEQKAKDKSLGPINKNEGGAVNGNGPNVEPWLPDPDPMTCTELLGPVLTKVLRGIITVMQILAGIIALVKGMIIFIPPILSKDSDALKKASKTLVTLLIVLAVVIAFRPVIRLFGSILGYDISCFM